MEQAQSKGYSSIFERSSIILALILVVAGAFSAFIATETARGLTVSNGEITSDTDWTQGDSPVIIEGNLSVASGATLTIGAGVDVYLEDDSWLEVKGRLIARGTADSEIMFTGSGAGGFSRINISGGGYAMMEHCTVESINAVNCQDLFSMVRIYNSTLDTGYSGLNTRTGAEVWAINCTFETTRNVTMVGGTIHEGEWFSFRAVKDINGDPVKDVNVVITATIPQGASWTIYDSVSDPDHRPTGSDGRIPLLAIEQYLHSGGVSNTDRKAMIQIKMNDTNRADILYPVLMTSPLDYTWEMDFTPPPAPVNLTVTSKGGSYINIRWDFPGNESKIRYFVIAHKKGWETSEDAWDIQQPGRSSRDWNISSENPPNPNGGLLEEMEYDIKISCVDGAENPSPFTGPITVKTLDVTPPESPDYKELKNVGGHFGVISWNRSSSEDVVGYDIFINGTDNSRDLFASVEATGEPRQTYNMTGLANDTTYTVWVAARDDGEIPNLSDLTEPLTIRTLDITSPVKPTLELIFDDPAQYLEDSDLYNGTQVALSGSIAGENRTFLDVMVDGELYVNPNPNAPRFASLEGSFLFFISLSEGEHRIKVRAEDPAGNVGPFSDEEIIILDFTDPTMNITVPGEGFIETDPADPITIESNADDENGIHNVHWNITGSGLDRSVVGAEMTEELPPGDYNVTVTVHDNAGNMNRTVFRIISREPDEIPPEAELISPTGSEDLDHAPVFRVSFSEKVDWEGLTAFVFRGNGTDGEGIQLIHDRDVENLTVDFQLTSSLSGGTYYTFALSSIFDPRGNRGDDLIFNFRTIDQDRMDSDSDGIPDHFEVTTSFLNPSNPDDGNLDFDGDGLTNLEEYQLGTDPGQADSDGDRMEDGWEQEHGLDPTDNSDALSDPDGDGYSNVEEFDVGTDPRDPADKPSAEEDGGFPVLAVVVVIAIVIIVAIVIVLMVISRNRKRDEAEEEKPPEGDEGPTWSEQEEASKRDCPSCGATLEEGLEYCPMCGAVLPEDEIVNSGSMEEDLPEEEEMMDEEEIMGEEPEDDIPGQEPPLMPGEGEGKPEEGIPEPESGIEPPSS